jgi:hypothetical protein
MTCGSAAVRPVGDHRVKGLGRLRVDVREQRPLARVTVVT